MKVLIVNRFFGGAQIPTGRMAEDLGRLLVDGGHEVVALASSGEYAGAVAQARDQESKRPKDEKTSEQRTECGDRRAEMGSPQGGALRVETAHVPKWMPRALAWVWFTWQARKRIPQMEWDVCVLMTDPPLLPLLAAKAACGENRGLARWPQGNRVTSDESGEAEKQPKDQTTETPNHRATRRVVVWLMDLYPEALAASGRIGTGNPIYRWYFEKRQQSLAAADLLICLGGQQKTLLGEALTKAVRTAVVPPWDDREEVVRADDCRLESLALYAGNLGEAHTFVDLLAAVPFLPNEWKLRFAVRGAKSPALRTAVQECGSNGRVIVSGYVSEDETTALLASARVHLITMASGWEGIVVPSKLYGCIRTGRPVLFIGPADADTAREILAHDWGKVLPPGASGEEVAAAILELAVRPTRAEWPQQGAAEVAALIVGA